MEGNYDKAKKTAGDYETMFGRGNFFLEIQDHGLAPDKAVTDAMFRLEKDLDIPLIATNDSHYIEDQDSRAHEILLCVQTAGAMNDPKRFKFDTPGVLHQDRRRDASHSSRTPRGLHTHHAVRRALQPWR
jgi:DNA polymerase-3 subunit alpha